MLRLYQPCIPVRSKVAPPGPQWVHEIKHDGYRLMVRRTDAGVRLITRGGYDWTKRYPVIRAAAESLRVKSATIDGEAVVCGPDGVSDFERLHSRGYDHLVVMWAFDLLEVDGVDLRARPLEERKAKLAKLIRRAPTGIHLVEHEAGDGTIIFEHACKMGLEGIVSKRRDASYRAGPCKSWLKIKNPASPAMLRLNDESWTWNNRATAR